MKKSGEKLNGANAAQFCLTCSQEKKLKKENSKSNGKHDMAVLRLGIARTSTDEDTFYIKHHRQRLRETKLNQSAPEISINSSLYDSPDEQPFDISMRVSRV